MRLLLQRQSSQESPAGRLFTRNYFLDALFSFPFALLFSLAWSYVFLLNVGLEFDLLYHLGLHSAVMLLVFLLVSFPLVAGILALGTAIVSLLSFVLSSPFFIRIQENLQGLIIDIRDSFLWSFESTQEGVIRPDNYIFLIAILAAGVAFFFIWHKPLPFFLGFFMLLPFFGGSGDVAENPTTVLALMVCAFILAYVFSREGKLLQKKKFFKFPPLFVSILILLAAFILQSFLPIDFFQNKNLKDRIRQIQKRLESPEIVNYFEFSLRDAGYYPMTQTLGGPLNLTQELFMQITGPQTALRLRGAVSEEYTGSAWRGQEMEPNYIFDNESSHGVQAKTFGYPTVMKDGENSLKALYDYSTIIIRPIQVPIQVIFNGGKPTKILLPEQEEQVLYYNEGGQIYAGLEITHPYSVEGWIPKELNADAKFSLIESELEKGSLSLARFTPSGQYEPMVRKHDPGLAAIVYDREAQSDLAKIQQLKAIEAHLKAYYTYTTDVAFPDSGEDFLEGFLRTKEGYCTYFSTAYALLAREAGIHARYVEGFVVPSVDDNVLSNDANFLRDVLSDSAHAWIEVKFEALGWYPFDATPAEVLAGITNDDSLDDRTPETTPPSEIEPTPPPTETSPETTPPSETPAPTPPAPSEERPTPPSSPQEEVSKPPFRISPLFKKLLLTLAGFILLFLLLYLYYRYSKKQYQKRHDPEHLFGLLEIRGEKDLLLQIWEDIKAMYELTDQTFPISKTLQQRFILLDQSFEDGKRFGSYPCFIAFEKSFYAEQKLSDFELSGIFEYYRVIEENLIQLMGKKSWYIKRFLFPNKTARF